MDSFTNMSTSGSDSSFSRNSGRTGGSDSYDAFNNSSSSGRRSYRRSHRSNTGSSSLSNNSISSFGSDHNRKSSSSSDRSFNPFLLDEKLFPKGDEAGSSSAETGDNNNSGSSKGDVRSMAHCELDHSQQSLLREIGAALTLSLD